MQLLRRPRPLDERECIARLYNGRSGLVEVVWPARPREAAVTPAGPTAELPALHLAIQYPRGRGTMTGEEVRAALAARMRAREAA